MTSFQYRNELLREAADRVSRSIQSADGAQVARLFRMLVPEVPPEEARQSSPGVKSDHGGAGEGTPVRVGIWQKRVREGKVDFVRRQEDQNQWRDWANVGRIEAKGLRFRVVLIGESVARGFFYEPGFTPALTLQRILEADMGAGTVEVIDLARTNLGIEARELAFAALALEPDALVLFCGNNWTGGAASARLSHGELECWIEALRTRGVSGLRDCVLESTRATVEGVVRDITDCYTRRDIPLYWMVPEFNLGDWHDQMKNAPYLLGRANREWSEAFVQAQVAMRSQNFREAIGYAQVMMRLDGGLSATPAAIVGQCNRHLGDVEAARHYLELARDAEMWDWAAVTTPRPVRLTQEIIRREATAPGVSVTDLPRIFAEYLQGDIADRRMFLDYCHLSSEGIRVGTAAVAAAILEKKKTRRVEWRQLLGMAPQPPEGAEADARLLAALHNAHWAQPAETISRLCAEALRAAPNVADTMALVAHLQSTRVPALLSRTTERLLKLDSQAAQHFIFHQSAQRYDKALVDSIVATVMAIDPGCGPSIADLRLRDHSAVGRSVNILDFYYSSSACQLEEMGWALPPPQFDKSFHRADFYRAYSPESFFFFVGDGNHATWLRMVLRLHSLERDTAMVRMQLNSEALWEGMVGTQWTAVEILLDPNVTLAGTNELQVAWPEPEFSGEAELAQVADRLARGIMCPLLPIYGEIHTATVSDQQ